MSVVADDEGAGDGGWEPSWSRRQELLERPEAAAAIRVADALRRQVHRLVTGEAEVGTMQRWAEHLEALEADVAPQPGNSRYDGYPATADAVAASFITHPVGGPANPVAVPVLLEVDAEAGSVRAECVYGAAFEGTPGVMHGGFVAATFDQVLGAAAALNGDPAVTGTLSIRYLHPTPVDTTLVFEGEYLGRRGRKVEVAGRCRAGDTVTAQATAVFVTIHEARFIPPRPELA